MPAIYKTQPNLVNLYWDCARFMRDSDTYHPQDRVHTKQVRKATQEIQTLIGYHTSVATRSCTRYILEVLCSLLLSMPGFLGAINAASLFGMRRSTASI